jgi:hypothetical protein
MTRLGYGMGAVVERFGQYRLCQRGSKGRSCHIDGHGQMKPASLLATVIELCRDSVLTFRDG